jgi:hypothetical protein
MIYLDWIVRHDFVEISDFPFAPQEPKIKGGLYSIILYSYLQCCVNAQRERLKIYNLQYFLRQLSVRINVLARR